jgi:hypothetical protein
VFLESFLLVVLWEIGACKHLLQWFGRASVRACTMGSGGLQGRQKWTPGQGKDNGKGTVAIGLWPLWLYRWGWYLKYSEDSDEGRRLWVQFRTGSFEAPLRQTLWGACWASGHPPGLSTEDINQSETEHLWNMHRYWNRECRHKGLWSIPGELKAKQIQSPSDIMMEQIAQERGPLGHQKWTAKEGRGGWRMGL